MHPTAVTSPSATTTRAAWSLDTVSRTLSGKALLAISASLVVALCAHLSFPLLFTPVPLTLSDLAVLLVGLMLGPQVAFAALVLYLAEGASGLPVFSPAGPGGVAQFLITGGYLIAYPFAAALAGVLVRVIKGMPPYATAAIAASAATILILTSGAIWLGIYTHHDAALTFKLAVFPFLPGQVVKIASAAGIYTALSRWRRA